jgi:hypothetical protein
MRLEGAGAKHSHFVCDGGYIIVGIVYSVVVACNQNIYEYDIRNSQLIAPVPIPTRTMIPLEILETTSLSTT